MARANFVKSARTDIYQNGTQTKADNKQGYTLDRSKPENKSDCLLVKKGESYWWWQFNFSKHKHISGIQPKQSQLTQSEFLSTFYGIQEDINERDFSVEGFEDELQDIKDSIQSLLDETQEKFDNMPEQLQENSSSGETLTERIDALESWISELDSMETDITHDDEDEICGMTVEELKEKLEQDNFEYEYGEYKEQADAELKEMKDQPTSSEQMAKYYINDNNFVSYPDGEDKFILGIIKHLMIQELKQQVLDDRADEVRNCECSL